MDFKELRQSLENSREDALRKKIKKENSLASIKDSISKLDTNSLETFNKFGLDADFLIDIDYDRLSEDDTYCNSIKQKVRDLIFKAKEILEREIC